MKHLLILLLFLAACHPFRHRTEIDWQEWKGSPVLFRFDAKWCPYCVRLEETIFKDKAVIALSKQFRMIRVDGDRKSADVLMKKYQVKGYPTLIFAKSDGTPVGAWLSDPDPQKFALFLMEMARRSEAHPSWQAFLDGTLKEVEMDDDPYWTEAEGLAKEGKTEEVKAVYRRGGRALLEKIEGASSLQETRSLLSGTILLLIEGEFFADAEKLAKKAVQNFPDDFLYYHRLATALGKQGKTEEAVEAARSAFEKSHGRNRTWVGEQLASLLIEQGKKSEAKTVIETSLKSVDWTTNTRQKELRYKEKLEALLKIL